MVSTNASAVQAWVVPEARQTKLQDSRQPVHRKTAHPQVLQNWETFKMFLQSAEMQPRLTTNPLETSVPSRRGSRGLPPPSTRSMTFKVPKPPASLPGCVCSLALGASIGGSVIHFFSIIREADPGGSV